MTPQELAHLIIESGLPDSEGTAGCSEADIADIESRSNVKLPVAYRDFLLALGRSSEDFFSDVSFVYPTIRDDQKSITNILGTFKLPASAYVFMVRNDLILFFDIKDGDDPPVYRYVQGDQATEKAADTFSEFLTDYLLTEIKMRKRSEELRLKYEARMKAADGQSST
jgi:hypothetical protein